MSDFSQFCRTILGAGFHVLNSSVDGDNVYIWVFGVISDFFQEHLVSFVLECLFTEEPGSMHVKSPRSLVSSYFFSTFISLTFINSFKVFHQHFKNNLFCWVLIHDNTTIEHTTDITT